VDLQVDGMEVVDSVLEVMMYEIHVEKAQHYHL